MVIDVLYIIDPQYAVILQIILRGLYYCGITSSQ